MDRFPPGIDEPRAQNGTQREHGEQDTEPAGPTAPERELEMQVAGNVEESPTPPRRTEQLA